jgi:hypothetical protein
MKSKVVLKIRNWNSANGKDECYILLSPKEKR